MKIEKAVYPENQAVLKACSSEISAQRREEKLF
jgi:hypothetical protein